MRLVDADRLRENLLHEQAKYMMSEHEQNRHTSAGFLLAVAELDSQPTVQAIPAEWIKAYADERWHHTVTLTWIAEMIKDWEAGK